MIRDPLTDELWLLEDDEGLSPEGCAAFFEFLEGLSPRDHKFITARVRGKLRLDHWKGMG